MTKPVEFSSFFRLLNSVKEGSKENQDALEGLLKEYASSEKSESFLHELGQVFIYLGVMELYQYAGTEDLQEIGNIDKSQWDELAKEKKGEIAPHLANTMINHFKKQSISKSIASKWGVSQREVNKNVMSMARYITEGLLDAID